MELNDASKPKIMIACNTLTSISIETYPYHVSLFYHIGRRHPEYNFRQLFAYRMSIDRFRNFAADAAIKQGCKYLMFLDDDMKLPLHSFSKLLEGCEKQGYHILAALNYIRGYPFKIMSFKFDLNYGRGLGRRLVNLTQYDLDSVPKDSIIPCDAIGTAVCLIDVDLLKRIPAPLFLTGTHGTEDIYMCLKALDKAPGTRIGTHLGVQTGHLLEPEIISHETRASLMAYYESFMTPAEIASAQQDNPAVAFIPDVGERELHYEDMMGVFNQPLIEKGR